MVFIKDVGLGMQRGLKQSWQRDRVALVRETEQTAVLLRWLPGYWRQVWLLPFKQATRLKVRELLGNRDIRPVLLRLTIAPATLSRGEGFFSQFLPDSWKQKSLWTVMAA